MEKIKIIAEKEAIIKLFASTDFSRNKRLKHIVKNLAEIILIMDKSDFAREWNDAESRLRKAFSAHELSQQPTVDSKLKRIFKSPKLCPELDAFALWLFDKSDAEIERLRDELGIWAFNPQGLSMAFFSLNHSGIYRKHDAILGKKNNGWGNFLGQIKSLPPSNSIVLNDKYLLKNMGVDKSSNVVFYGLENLKDLLSEILPNNLKVTFHITILCLHPDKAPKIVDGAIDQFVTGVKALKKYPIEIEFVYASPLHERDLHTNYYRFFADRGYDAFLVNDKRKLSGENHFNVVSYLNDPYATGATEYDIAKFTLNSVSIQRQSAYLMPKTSVTQNQDIQRVYSAGGKSFDNRLLK